MQQERMVGDDARLPGDDFESFASSRASSAHRATTKSLMRMDGRRTQARVTFHSDSGDFSLDDGQPGHSSGSFGDDTLEHGRSGEVSTFAGKETFLDLRPRATLAMIPKLSLQSRETEVTPADEPTSFLGMQSRSTWGMKHGELCLWTGWRWQRRFFILHNGHLRWWTNAVAANSGSAEPLGSVSLIEGATHWEVMKLHGCHLQLGLPADRQAHKRYRVERYTLTADTPEGAADWVEAIFRHLAHINALILWPMPMEGRQGDFKSHGRRE